MTAEIKQEKVTGIRHYIPILSWLPNYQGKWLRLDLIAGLTIMALLVPEGMAYAELAGVPPQTAFYAAPAGLIAYAIFGSSRQLVVAERKQAALILKRYWLPEHRCPQQHPALSPGR